MTRLGVDEDLDRHTEPTRTATAGVTRPSRTTTTARQRAAALGPSTEPRDGRPAPRDPLAPQGPRANTPRVNPRLRTTPRGPGCSACRGSDHVVLWRRPVTVLRAGPWARRPQPRPVK
jgi:hypothetical protein